MFRKVDKVFIGKDLTRTVAVADGAGMTVIQANIVEGEVIVLDKGYKVAPADITYTDSDTIYIAEGSEEIFETVNPDGSALTGRRLLISSPIDGSRVVRYEGDAYAAKVEAASSTAAISDTIVAGTEYVLRIVYKGDIAAQHPGQNLATYRYIAKTGDVSSDVYDGLVLRINKSNRNNIKRTGKALITAVNNAGVLELTAKAVTSCTTSVNDIDELVMNSFEVFLNYVDSDYSWTEVTTTSATTYTKSFRGYGSWETIRDVEKHAQSYSGVSNRVWFPVIKPQMRTVKGAEYDLINIESDIQYRSPDNQYNKETSVSTLIAFVNGSAQGVTVLTTLNAWVASLPKPFTAISFA